MLGATLQRENLIVNGGFEEWVPRTQVTANLLSRPRIKDLMVTPTDLWPKQWILQQIIERDAPPPGSNDVALDETVAHSGKRSLRISNRTSKVITLAEYRTEYAVGTTALPTPIQPNRHYRLSWWVKGQDIIPGGAMMEGSAYFTKKDGKGAIVGIDYRDQGIALAGTFDWQQRDITFITDAGAQWFTFTLQLRNTAGIVWYDDVALEDLGPAVVVETY
ncbi:MAG TPA: hypothetical protein VGM23_00705 [Armatimonadota bacterium]